MNATLVLPYFGQFPSYFQLFLNSVARNKEYRLLLATDCCLDDYAMPANVTVERMRFSEIQRRVRALTSASACIDTPYKLCDYRPLYGLLFQNELRGADFWGFCDADMLWGRISRWVTPDVFESYDKISTYGHFTLLRNEEPINRLALKYRDYECGLSMAESTELSCYFDEIGFSLLVEKVGLRVFKGIKFADVAPNRYGLTLAPSSHCENMRHQRFYYNKGVLCRTVPGRDPEEFSYIHLQKRTMDLHAVGPLCDSFEIRPDGFYPLDASDEGAIAHATGRVRHACGFGIAQVSKFSPKRVRLSARIKCARRRLRMW